MSSCSCSCSTPPPARRRRPSAALVVASLALVVGLGGTSYAATVASNSVGNAQLKSDAVTSAKIAPGGVTRSDIRAGQVFGTAIAPNAVDGARVDDESLGSADIIDGSLNNGDIAGNTIDGTRIADNTLGLVDIESSAKDSLVNIPSEVVTNNFQGDPDTLDVDSTYNPVLSWGTDADHAGGSILLAQVTATAPSPGDATTLTCRIVRQPAGTAEQDVELTSSTMSLQDRQTSTLTLMTPATLATSDAVQVQCKRTSTGFATVDTGDTAGHLNPTAMTILRVARP